MSIFLALIIGAVFGGYGVFLWMKAFFKDELRQKTRKSWLEGWNQSMVLAKEDGWEPNETVVKKEDIPQMPPVEIHKEGESAKQGE